MAAKQDDITRRRRLNNGCCPTHGIPLQADGVVWREGRPIAEVVSCPRRDCNFTIDVGPDQNKKVWDAITGLAAKRRSA